VYCVHTMHSVLGVDNRGTWIVRQQHSTSRRARTHFTHRIGVTLHSRSTLPEQRKQIDPRLR
jgi:hypothetical protein